MKTHRRFGSPNNKAAIYWWKSGRISIVADDVVFEIPQKEAREAIERWRVMRKSLRNVKTRERETAKE